MNTVIPKINAKFSFQDSLYSFFNIFSQRNVEIESSIFYLNHARTALRISLSALNLPEGSKIGVTAYNCLTVMNVIHIAGYKPVFIDITDDLRIDLKDLKNKNNQLSAIIVTHLFGLPNNLKEIKEVCNNIPIIEDCAHSFLSRSEDYVVGTLGDIVVYSIGQGKFPSIGNGGILLVNNKKFYANINSIYATINRNSILEELKSLLIQIFISITHIPYLYYYTSNFKQKRKSNVQNNFTYKHTEKKMDSYVLSLYLKNKHKFPNYLKQQQVNTKKILEILSKSGVFRLIKIDIHNNNCFMLPVFSDERTNLEKRFFNKGIEITSHFSKSIEWALKFGYKIGDCPKAEKISNQLLIVPVHYNLSSKSIKKIINILLENGK